MLLAPLTDQVTIVTLEDSAGRGHHLGEVQFRIKPLITNYQPLMTEFTSTKPTIRNIWQDFTQLRQRRQVRQDKWTYWVDCRHDHVQTSGFVFEFILGTNLQNLFENEHQNWYLHDFEAKTFVMQPYFEPQHSHAVTYFELRISHAAVLWTTTLSCSHVLRTAHFSCNTFFCFLTLIF